MRVISGTARGMALAAPKGLATRPTADRAREALFNILGDVRGLSVLDLFAGSGAIGIEALSRGGLRCVFVEHGREAAEAIQKNLTKARLADRAEIMRVSYDAAIARLAARGERFGFVYADPPYRMGLAISAYQAVKAAGVLSENAVFALETAADERIGIGAVTDSRRYGAACIHIIRG